MDGTVELLRTRHCKFLNRCLQILPSEENVFDKRPVMLFFALCGLDLLDELPKNRQKLVDWLYSLQLGDSKDATAGFHGGFVIDRASFNRGEASSYDVPSVTMTYTVLASLVTLGDDFGRVRRREILRGLRCLQQPDGSFASQLVDGEIDIRFVYCAACVAYMLDDLSSIDSKKCVQWILACLTYEGAFGCVPGAEAHGGATFCAVATLALLGCLDTTLAKDRKLRLIQWCLFRQERGFNGRPNKLMDTCYSFWIGGSLRILGAFEYSSSKLNREFLLESQCPITGGIGKIAGNGADPLHTYLGLAGLSFIGKDNLQEMYAPLNISTRAHKALKQIHKLWSSPTFTP